MEHAQNKIMQAQQKIIKVQEEQEEHGKKKLEENQTSRETVEKMIEKT